MQKSSIAVLAVTMFMLAGCSVVSDPNKRDAGKWNTEIKLEKFELTGIPPQMQAQAEQMKAQIRGQIENQMQSMGGKQECLTAIAASQEDISKALAKELSGAGECNFTKSIVANGKIDVAGTCKMSGQPISILMSGSMAPKKVDVLLTMSSPQRSEGANVAPGMNTSLRMVTTHAGKCDS
jgi:hypothetical protein